MMQYRAIIEMWEYQDDSALTSRGITPINFIRTLNAFTAIITKAQVDELSEDGRVKYINLSKEITIGD
jgi:hypothetical protein